MKKILLTLFLFLSLLLPATAAETPEICGNTYSFTFEATTYVLKFASYNPALPCAGGTATLMWNGQKISYPFAVYNSHFALITGLGTVAADGDNLYFLETATIFFELF